MNRRNSRGWYFRDHGALERETVADVYKELRKPATIGDRVYYTPATYAMRDAHTLCAWRDHNGYVTSDYEDDDRDDATVRLVIMSDDEYSFATDFDCGLPGHDDEGATFDHSHLNIWIGNSRATEYDHLCREKVEVLERADRDGMHGVQAQYRDPLTGAWVDEDSCWGFVGDDWMDDAVSQFMAPAIDARDKAVADLPNLYADAWREAALCG